MSEEIKKGHRCCIEAKILESKLKQAEKRAEAYREAFEKMRDALDEIKNGALCHRCEGNGRMWADGKAHTYSPNRETIACGYCAGEGRVMSLEAVDIEGILTLANQVSPTNGGSGNDHQVSPREDQ